MKFRSLDYKDIISINIWAQRVIEDNIVPSFGIREDNLLRSIPEMVNQNIGGQELYPTIYDKASYLWNSLSKYHCFLDGNKRTALSVILIYLKFNGYELDILAPDLYDTCMKLASENMNKETAKNYLIEHVSKDKHCLYKNQEATIVEILNEFKGNSKLILILEKLGN